MINYFKEAGMRRLVIMIAGNILLGMGISIFKLSGLGNDPYSGMVMAFSDVAGINYAFFLILINVVLFGVEFLTGKKFVGLGTLINALLLGYIVTFFYDFWVNVFGIPTVFWQQFIVVCIGVVVCSLGVSMYQTPDMGVAPYDSLSLIMDKKIPKLSYFWCRMITDTLCSLLCFLAGGIIGIGTLISALGLGPIIHFFNVNVTEKLLRGEPLIAFRNRKVRSTL